MPTITPDAHVGTVARQSPATVKVFQRRRIDFCCGGKKPLSEACAAAGLPLDDVLGELRDAAAGPTPEQDWSAAPLPALVGHIIERYHQALQRDLPVLRELAAKVALRHGGDQPALVEIRDVVERLAAEMTSHMQKEEVVLFPLAIRLGAGERGAEDGSWIVEGPIAVMEHEHEEVAQMLARLAELTGDFVAAANACNSFRGLYAMLAELDVDTRMHIHLENNILFPRVEELALQPAT
jgi:regulator of cell morphogenesis and NO signaling